MGYFKNLIVSDLGSKNLVKLKDMSLASTMFNDVELARSCSEIINLLNSKKKNHFDLIITSYRFEENELLKLIKQVKEMKNKFNGAVLMVLPTAIKLENVGDHFFAGVDGFLLEPYGVTDLEEMFKLAQSVSLFAKEQREEALEIILGQAIAQIDKIALQKSENKEERNDKLGSIKHASLKLGEEHAETYKKIALEKIVGQATPTNIVGGDQEKLKAFVEHSSNVANTENDFSNKEDPEIEAYIEKLKTSNEDKLLIREGIYRIKKLLTKQGITIDTKEIINVANEQGKKFNEDDAMERLRKKMEALGGSI